MGLKQNFRQPFLLPKFHKEGVSLRPIKSTIWVSTYSPSTHPAGLSIYAAPFSSQVAYSSALKVKASGFS